MPVSKKRKKKINGRKTSIKTSSAPFQNRHLVHKPSARRSRVSTSEYRKNVEAGLPEAAGLTAHFIEQQLYPETRLLLERCSRGGLYSETLSELAAYGILPNSEVASWLNEIYLGTWVDKTFSSGAFLRDLEGQDGQSEQGRITAYSRLCQMIRIQEIAVPDGRTVVLLEEPIDLVGRIMANQWMIHGTVPMVITT